MAQREFNANTEAVGKAIISGDKEKRMMEINREELYYDGSIDSRMRHRDPNALTVTRLNGAFSGDNMNSMDNRRVNGGIMASKLSFARMGTYDSMNSA